MDNSYVLIPLLFLKVTFPIQFRTSSIKILESFRCLQKYRQGFKDTAKMECPQQYDVVELGSILYFPTKLFKKLTETSKGEPIMGFSFCMKQLRDER